MSPQPEKYNTIEEALAQNLDKEGLIRLRAVDKTIEFAKDRNIDEKKFMILFETIYNSLTAIDNLKS